jgi:hypothetical protein
LLRPAAPVFFFALSIIALTGVQARCATVTDLAARHRHGQTFLTWTAPSGGGWTYRVYASPAAITNETELAQASYLGSVGDSTWCDLRLSRILGTVHGYAIDSAGTPLSPSQALFVVTPGVERRTYYAVTARAAGGLEDRALAAGTNTLLEPVTETLARPRPVYQRSVVRYSAPVEIYTLWTSPTATPLFPAMANRHGLAFDCGIVRGEHGGALMVRPHPYGQNFLLVTAGSGEPGEWRLTLDDPLPTPDNHTWWFGYHETYDVTSGGNLPPLAGTVQDYTFRRVEFSVEWARRSFPVDWNRTYASGYSMGGIGSLWLALRRPDLIAAIHAEVPRFDFTHQDDPDPTNLWNATGSFRRQGDRLWGAMATNLMASTGMKVYDQLDMRALAAASRRAGMPPVVVFTGKNDRVLGWAEKIPFFAEMNRNRLGGYFFWDTRTHTSAGAWDPMKTARYLHRFRHDLSFPALSGCSADSDPGDGTATAGDSVGAVNAFVEWDAAIVDRATEWSTTLRLRDLTASFGAVRAPDSLRVDVTPRRLQAFQVWNGTRYRYTVTRLLDGAIVRSGILAPDADGLLTVRAVTVPRGGCVLRLEAAESGAVSIEPIGGPTLAIGANPVVESTRITFTSPATGAAEIDLYDVTGRLVSTLHRGPVRDGALSLRLDAAKLPSGVYFLVARQDGAQTARRVVVAR